MAYGRVASRSIPPLSISPEELQRQLTSNRQTDRIPTAAELAPNPEGDIQRNMAQVPRIPMDDPNFRGVPLQDQPRLGSAEELAAATQTPFDRPIMSPVVDAQGNAVIDPNTGQPAQRMVGLDDYNQQRDIEQAGIADQSAALGLIAQKGFRETPGAIADLVRNRQEAMFDASARLDETLMSQEEIDRFAQRTTAPLTEFINKVNSWLFSPDASIKSIIELADGQKSPGQTGIAIKLTRQLDDDTMDQVGVVSAVAFMRAVTQTPREGSKGPSNSSGKPLDDTTYYNDMIGAMQHYIKNGLNNNKIELDDDAVSEISKSIIANAVASGDLKSFDDPKTNRKILEAADRIKKPAREASVLAEALIGDVSRQRSSITPQRSGSNFTIGKPQKTYKSLNYPGIVTAAADLTKDIMGSTGSVFRVKDVQFKEIELGLVLQEQYAVYDQAQRFMYSTHPLASRINLGYNDYKAAEGNVKKQEGYDATDERQRAQFEQMQAAQATDVMNAKLQKAKYDIENAKKSPGVRFTGYTHSLNNQRFFPTNFDTDYMGSKNMIRDMMGLAAQDAVYTADLFDGTKVAELKSKGVSILKKNGVERHKLLEALTPNERAAIGTMINAVINYESAISPTPDPNIASNNEADILAMYTPEIGNQLADVGRKYNEFLQNPEAVDDDFMGLLVGMEKGESLGSKNLWDDMFQLKEIGKANPQGRQSYALTHHAFDDGNQNGIFLQALFFGNAANAMRLGTFNPNLDDMRTYAMKVMLDNLDKQLRENMNDSEKADAFKNFWSDLMRPENISNTAKTFFKAPLMQNSYGKDASMFGDLMYELLHNDAFFSRAQEELGTAFNNDLNEAATALSNAVEATLREVNNDAYARLMKNIGRFTGITNTPLMIPNVTGDTSVFAPVNTTLLNKSVDDTQPIETTLPDGRKVLLKKKATESTLFSGPDGEVDIQTLAMQYDPSYAKPTQKFWNRKTLKYDEFHNVLGSAQARIAVVSPIQAMDGDLVKWTNIFVNKDQKTPRPALWVHDSIISTPGSSLIYRNAYNNIAIPGMADEVGKMGKKFEAAVKDAHWREKARVMERGAPVGIGADGHYPALGALFDEIYDNLNKNHDGWKDRQMKRSGNNVERVNKREQDMAHVLEVALENGWIEPDSLNSEQHKDLAVTPVQFGNLLDEASKYLKLSGPQDALTPWANNFASNVKDTYKQLITTAKDIGGIAQMTYGATGERKTLPADWRKSKEAKPLPSLENTKKVEPRNYLESDDTSAPF